MQNESGIIIEEDVVKATPRYVFSQLNASEIYDAFHDTLKIMGYVARHVLAEMRVKKSRFKSVHRDFSHPLDTPPGEEQFRFFGNLALSPSPGTLTGAFSPPLPEKAKSENSKEPNLFFSWRSIQGMAS